MKWRIRWETISPGIPTTFFFLLNVWLFLFMWRNLLVEKPSHFSTGNMYPYSLDDDSKLHLLGYTVNSRSKHPHGKRKWNRKKRISMSFLMVIAFFTVFVLIILIEIFVIDGKTTAYGNIGNGGGEQHISYNGIDEFMPDFDDVNDEYSIENAVFGRNRFRDKHRGKLTDGYLHCTGPKCPWRQ